MSTSQEDVIELIELNSNVSSRSRPKRRHARNKVGHPPSTTVSSPSRSSEISGDVFLAKSRDKPPVPKPRSKSSETSSLRSKNKSYREKVKSRFEAVKKHAGKSADEIEKLPRLKGASERIVNLNRSVEAIKRENQAIDNDLKRRETKIAGKDQEEVTRYDKYAFFCEERLTNRSDDDEKDLGGESKERLIDDWVVCRKPENLEFFLALASNEVIWSPLNSKITVADKLNVEELRNLTEEGFYVPERPRVRESEIKLLERRLLNDDDCSKWFDCQGTLKLLENPHNGRAFRPLATKHQPFTEFVRPTLNGAPISLDAVKVAKENVFDVHVHSIKFRHHPLFSIEHVLCEKLIELYDTYREHATKYDLRRIAKKIDALHRAAKNLEDALKESGDRGPTKRLTDYRREIRALNETLLTQSKEYRDHVKSILETWKTLKKVREANNLSNTTIRLSIRKEKCDYYEEKKHTKRRIRDYFHNEMFLLRLAHEEMVRDRNLQMGQTNQNGEDDENREESAFNIDEDILQDEIEQRFKESLKPPGEPYVFFGITHENELTPVVDDVKEKLRRTSVAATKIHFKLFCNGMFVCKSKTVALNDTFTCLFDESFAIYLKQPPECLTVEIYEQPGALLNRKIGAVRLSFDRTDLAKIREEYFAKEEILHYNKHSGVGSGIELSDLLKKYDVTLNENVSLFTCGFLNFNLSWTNNVDDDSDSPQGEDATLRQILKSDGTIDVEKLKEWTRENALNPLDPKNSLLFEYIEGYPQVDDIQEDACFRLDPDLTELNFCDAAELEANARFKLLQLRDRNVPEFVGMVVPNRIKEIPTNVLTDYYKRLSVSLLNDEENDEDSAEGTIENRRSRGYKNLRLIYTRTFQKCRNVNDNVEYEDVVNETTVKHVETIIRTITYNVINWFKLQPSISKPLPKLLNTATAVDNVQEVITAQPKVIVSIVSATNVPKRGVHEDDVQPFVVVALDESVAQTAIANGTNPVWDEILTLPLLQSPTDLSEQHTFDKHLLIRLFDRTRTKINLEESDFDVYLGRIRVPLSAVFLANKISGTFVMEKPSILFGYDLDQSHKANCININEPTYLTMSIIIEPNLPKIHPNMEELPSSEPPYLKGHVLDWNKSYNVNFPSRKFNALVLDATGKSVCTTRYLRPLEPPQVNRDGFDVTPHQCARYVASVPFIDTNYFYNNVWLTTEQMLKMHFGTIFDHAVALTCYFLALNLDAWLILGSGLPDGITACVLVKESINRDTEKVYFYDVVSGKRYNVEDTTIKPMQTIFCAINGNNIWANIQKSDNVATVRYDFHRRNDWSRLFDTNLTAPSNTVQSKLNYWTDTTDVEVLETRIEKRMRKKIAKRRRFNRTVWNHAASALFKKTMRNLERQILSESNKLEVHSDVRYFLQSNNVTGYVLNAPFKSVKTVIEWIESTGIHLNNEPNVEYISSIHLHAYSNHVIVVWSMIGIIKRE